MKEQNNENMKEKPGFFKRIKLRFKKFLKRHFIKITVTTLIILFFFTYFWNNVFISIHPGERGVLWKRFGGIGTVMTGSFCEGLQIIPPWDKMYVYDVRIQEMHDTVKMLTKEGLYINIDVSFRFRPNPIRQGEFNEREKKNLTDEQKKFWDLPELHKTWGPEYAEKFVRAEAKAATISVLGQYEYEKLYTENTTEIQDDIKAIIVEEFSGEGTHIQLHDFLISRIAIPDSIKDAIERKLARKQLLSEYKYILDVARQEKEKKRIEAMGIQLFEEISKIPILKWRGLAVTSELAQSENAKVIVIGTGSKDLPIILSADK